MFGRPDQRALGQLPGRSIAGGGVEATLKFTIMMRIATMIMMMRMMMRWRRRRICR